MARTHMITGDDSHCLALIAELETNGAKVIPVFSGGLGFSIPVERYFYKKGTNDAIVDIVVNCTGFAMVGGPARPDHPKAIAALKRLDRHYICSLPLAF